MKARATFASVLVLLALTAALVGIAASPAFAASCGGGQGQSLLLGCDNNTAIDATFLRGTKSGSIGLSVHESGSSSFGVVGEGQSAGLFGQGGNTGVYGSGSNTGVYGSGDIYGVYGSSTQYGVLGISTSATGVYGETIGVATQNGVWGQANDYGGSGVYGQNDGTGYGVGGRTTNVDGGTGVIGDAPNSANGIGVEADSATGTALNVQGKAVFSRSGIVTVAAGKSSLTVILAGVTTASMVLATAQQNTGVYVKAAVPGSGSFTIRLTGKAPTGGLKVAYFVLN